MMEVFAPRHLDENGRCCGRKTHPYQTIRGMGGTKDPHSCCFKCDAEYDADGHQRANWAWLACDGGFTPKYPESAYVDRAREASNPG